MTHAILFTAWARPEILRQTLESWDKVRGIQDWSWYFSIEPSVQLDAVHPIIRDFISRNELPSAKITINPRVHGVLHHPWVGFEHLFNEGFDFVIRAEDDLCVSDDILDYFTWAELTYRERSDVATIHAYTDGTGQSPNGVETLTEFNPWIWGTWKRWWKDLIGPTWDHDYSTFNETPGFQSGWDWNLNTRIFPLHELKGVYPKMSRVDNIGVYGTHSHPGNWRTAPTFRAEYGVHDYRES